MTRIADRLYVDPDVRWAAYVFDEMYAAAPQGAWFAPGMLRLLGGPDAALMVGVPWGAVVAADLRGEGPAELYSLNDDHGPIPVSVAPAWADPFREVLAEAGTGLRAVVSRLLPAQTGLLSGAETATAFALALRDLRGVPPSPQDPALRYAPGHAVLTGPASDVVPFPLAGLGLRLVIMEVGVAAVVPQPTGDAIAAAKALRGGDPEKVGALLSAARRPCGSAADLALDAAAEAGALGGRTIGRCAVALAPLEAVPAIRAAVAARLAGVVPRPPRILTAASAEPARRVG
ncbi:hypothetical protein [Thermomonospora amylolytica]|uniref:hypothetical protein n=1 Tax=Thermomonospora amylolytica TaxID=1411117 RepID=UPI000E6D082B|nr:hypothetical protein [Thermomonospora amylolytica]